MSQPDSTEEPAPASAAADVTKPVAEATVSVEPSAPDQGLDAQLAELKEANQKLGDEFLRLRAEMENQAKRLQAENERAVQRGVSQVVSGLLEVADNLERALAEDQGADVKNIQQGVRMTLGQLQGIMAANGIEAINPSEGEKLNPELHAALMQEEKAGFGTSQVIRTIAKGYRHGQRILRPAHVAVGSASAGKQGDDNQQPPAPAPSGPDPDTATPRSKS